jgi:cell division protein FtsL
MIAFLMNVPKPVWFMFLVVFAILGSIIGVSTHIDTLQFQEIDRLNEKIHDLDKQVAINNERILEEQGQRNYHPSL